MNWCNLFLSQINKTIIALLPTQLVFAGFAGISGGRCTAKHSELVFLARNWGNDATIGKNQACAIISVAIPRADPSISRPNQLLRLDYVVDGDWCQDKSFAFANCGCCVSFHFVVEKLESLAGDEAGGDEGNSSDGEEHLLDWSSNSTPQPTST